MEKPKFVGQTTIGSTQHQLRVVPLISTSSSNFWAGYGHCQVMTWPWRRVFLRSMKIIFKKSCHTTPPTWTAFLFPSWISKHIIIKTTFSQSRQSPYIDCMHCIWHNDCKDYSLPVLLFGCFITFFPLIRPSWWDLVYEFWKLLSICLHFCTDFQLNSKEFKLHTNYSWISEQIKLFTNCWSWCRIQVSVQVQAGHLKIIPEVLHEDYIWSGLDNLPTCSMLNQKMKILHGKYNSLYTVFVR